MMSMWKLMQRQMEMTASRAEASSAAEQSRAGKEPKRARALLAWPIALVGGKVVDEVVDRELGRGMQAVSVRLGLAQPVTWTMIVRLTSSGLARTRS